MNIGHAIKLCRASRHLSQAQLSALTGYSTSHLSLIENNKRDPSLSTIEKIAVALNVPLGILFFLAADSNDLSGIDKELAGSLSRMVLELLNEKDARDVYDRKCRNPVLGDSRYEVVEMEVIGYTQPELLERLK